MGGRAMAESTSENEPGEEPLFPEQTRCVSTQKKNAGAEAPAFFFPA